MEEWWGIKILVQGEPDDLQSYFEAINEAASSTPTVFVGGVTREKTEIES